MKREIRMGKFLGLLSVIALAVISGYQTSVASAQVDCIFKQYEKQKQLCVGQDTFCQLCNQVSNSTCSRWNTIYTNNILHGVKSNGTKWYTLNTNLRCFEVRDCIATPVAASKCDVLTGGYSICKPTNSEQGCLFCTPFVGGIVQLEKDVTEVDCPIGIQPPDEG